QVAAGLCCGDLGHVTTELLAPACVGDLARNRIAARELRRVQVQQARRVCCDRRPRAQKRGQPARPVPQHRDCLLRVGVGECDAVALRLRSYEQVLLGEEWTERGGYPRSEASAV